MSKDFIRLAVNKTGMILLFFLLNTRPMNYQTTVKLDGKFYTSLRDILPSHGELKMLIVGRTPSHGSIVKGHYFQGTRGKSLWNKLRNYGILDFPQDRYADEYLLENNYGIIHLSPIPCEYRELDRQLTRRGYKRLMAIVRIYRPKMLLFSYKNIVDSIVDALDGTKIQTNYGFNPMCEVLFNGVPVFIFPMPGTPCTKEEATTCMDSLVSFLKQIE